MLLLIALVGNAKALEIEKSPNDQREYRHVVLENGLKVTLIHDAHTETAAAAMDVAVGSGSDPADRPGLAHFLEHMLFLGTEKHPQPGDYAQFIKQHGGGNNAYTSFSNTNYFFNIEPEMLEPALDRFAQFFIAPLFAEQLVQREKSAVHSEFSGGLKNDSRRFYSARKRAFN
ncbi:MAG: insulinase family protein, partial [Granulosicoccus sp.]